MIGYSPEQKEINFHAVDYSNHDCIKGLLRFYYHFGVEAAGKYNWELVTILTDVKNALAHCLFTSKQANVLRLYKLGYAIDEIGNFMGITHQSVEDHLKGIAKKISKFLLKDTCKKVELSPYIVQRKIA